MIVNKDKKTKHIFLYLFLGVCGFLSACSEEPIAPLYGAPTPIPINQQPMDVVCQIQNEFKQLPKPLMTRYSYQSEWTSRPIGAASVKHRGFVKVHLREEGLSFLQQHSRLEIVASLSPLIHDDELGGEVAVLLAGIPAGDKAEQGSLTRGLAGMIDQRAYSSPSRPGQWHSVDEFKFYYLNRFYGLLNTSARIHQREIDNYSGTLEQALEAVLQAYSKMPAVPLAEGRVNIPQPHNDAAIAQWISEHGVPDLIPKAEQFIQQQRSNFAALALLPLMPQPSAYLESTEYYMMWLLSLEETFWPAVISVPRGELIPATLRQQLRQKIAETANGFCPN